MFIAILNPEPFGMECRGSEKELHMALSRRILIALCGLSPAVVTETVYALRNENPAWTPDELVVVTTRAGAELLKSELLDSGVFKMLKELLGRPDISFADTSHHIRIIPSGDGESDSDDILSSADNDRMADFLVGVLRQYTEDPDTELMLSIAGGRKTMSAVAALAMSLLGRERDGMCHVLVPPPFDDPKLNPKFYFPTEPPIEHKTPDGAAACSSKAVISLCRVPFMRLRYLFDKQYLRLPGSFSGTVEMANAAIHPESLPQLDLELRPDSLTCVVGESLVALSAFEFAVFWLLALRRKGGLPPVRGQKELLEEYEGFVASTPASVMPSVLDLRSQGGKSDEDMRKAVGSIAKKIREASKGQPGVSLCLPSLSRGLYGIALKAGRVHCPGNH